VMCTERSLNLDPKYISIDKKRVYKGNVE
jgi:hypothetical protein